MPIISRAPLGYLLICKLGKKQDYSGLLKALDRFQHVELFEGVWMIRTREAAAEIHRRIYKRIDAEDQFIIAEITDQTTWSSAIPVEKQIWIKEALHLLSPGSYR